MKTYLLKRFLLIFPTLFGITIICFFIMQAIPGGPVEQAMQSLKHAAQNRGGSASWSAAGNSLTGEELQNIRHYYGFDKPVLIRYITWIGKLIRGDFGISYTYEQPVLKIIFSRIPVSLIFGVTGLLLTYLICIPLGVSKALEYNRAFDNATTFLILLGYSIPSFVLGVILIVIFGGGSFLNVFPVSGMMSDNFDDLGLIPKIFDIAKHMILPVTCYTISGFAVLTLLMKNSMMEQLNQDYMRTALAKGLTFRQAVYRHALRNAMIPIATNIGMLVTVFLSGSILIETVFSINGMGLLEYESILNRDYPVALGLIVISSILVLIGRIVSDICLVIVDPRIRFE